MTAIESQLIPLGEALRRCRLFPACSQEFHEVHHLGHAAVGYVTPLVREPGPFRATLI